MRPAGSGVTGFVRLIRPLLDRRTRRQFVLSAVVGVGVAGVEAIGLLILVPLVQLIAQPDGARLPASTRWLAGRLDDPSPLRLAAILGVIALAAFLLKGVSTLIYLRWNFGLVLRSEAQMSARLLRAYLHAPYAFHLSRNSAELQRAVSEDVRVVYEDALVALISGAADAVLIAAVAAVLIAVEPLMAACAALYFLLVAIGYQRAIHGRARSAGEEIGVRAGEAHKVVQQGVAAVKDIQIRHRQEFFVDQLFAVRSAAARRLRTLLLLYQAPRYFLEIALIVGVGLMAAIVYPLRSSGEATAVLSLFIAAGLRLLPSINRVLVALDAVRAGEPALGRISADLALLKTAEAAPGEGPQSLRAPADATVEFDRVDFAYGAAAPAVLHGASFVIRPGESVAFVGASGAGKSTLLDLMLGLLEPTSGTIRVGGVPMPQVRAGWQRSIGYVPQDVVVVDESLRANVALGVPAGEVDDADVIAALEEAELAGVWRSLPEGLDTRLGERGVRLSGGQRQRVGLARALYQRPSVLVLDEATSSLDSATESRITETIDALHHRLTLVVVTHRLSTVRRCDRIHLLQDGWIIGVGHFDTLLADSQVFADLVRRSLGRRREAPSGPVSDHRDRRGAAARDPRVGVP